MGEAREGTSRRRRIGRHRRRRARHGGEGGRRPSDRRRRRGRDGRGRAARALRPRQAEGRPGSRRPRRQFGRRAHLVANFSEAAVERGVERLRGRQGGRRDRRRRRGRAADDGPCRRPRPREARPRRSRPPSGRCSTLFPSPARGGERRPRPALPAAPSEGDVTSLSAPTRIPAACCAAARVARVRPGPPSSRSAPARREIGRRRARRHGVRAVSGIDGVAPGPAATASLPAPAAIVSPPKPPRSRRRRRRLDRVRPARLRRCGRRRLVVTGRPRARRRRCRCRRCR